MGRSELREHIFRILFGIDFNTREEMQEQIQFYVNQLNEVKEKDLKYMEQKYMRIMDKIEDIDKLLNEHTVGWKTIRMNKVDLTILRLAIFEMKWDEDVPEGVAINEAVELAKKYSSEEGPAFVNGVLAKLTD